MSVGLQQGGRPPYVTFKKGQVEDRTATMAAGHYVSRTVDYAIVRQSGDKNSNETEVGEWLDRISRNPGYPREWVDGFRKAYELWKNGQDAPLNGYPIREWGGISPDQREMLLQLTVCTVEDLAAANESTLQRIGMGSRELKQKAQAWLDTSKNVGKVVEQIGAVQVENAELKRQIEELRAFVKQQNGQPLTQAGNPRYLPPALTAGVNVPAPAPEEDPFV